VLLAELWRRDSLLLIHLSSEGRLSTGFTGSDIKRIGQGGYAVGLPLVQAEAPVVVKDEEWTKTIDAGVLSSLPLSEITRQKYVRLR